MVVTLYVGYDATRGLRHGRLSTADHDGRLLLHWEQAAHLAPEHPLNQVLWHVPLLAVLGAYFYATLHFLVTPGVLVWLYRRHPRSYRQARTVLASTTVMALVGFWSFPTTPPRLLPGSGIRDTLADVHRWGWWSGRTSAPRGLGSLANEFAAMPSLHVAWALWAGSLIARHARHRTAKIAGLVYPVLTAVVVMSTGEHYLLDVLAGAALVGVAAAVSMIARAHHDRVGSHAVSLLCADRLAMTIPPTWSDELLMRKAGRSSGELVQDGRSRRRRHVRVIVAGLLVGALATEGVIVGPDVGGAARSLSHPDLWWLLVALLAQVMSLSAFGHLRRRMLFAGGTRIAMRRISALTYAANAVNLTLPAGTALSAGYTFRRLRGWGASAPVASFTLIASGVLSSVAFGLLGISGAVLFGADHSNPVLLAAGVLATIGAVLFVRRLSHQPHALVNVVERGLRCANRLLRRTPEFGHTRVHQFVHELTQIKPRHWDWLAGLLFAGLNWIADLFCLVACCRAVGAHDATIALTLIAYLAGMSVSSVSLLPGGLGVVDATIILALSHGGVNLTSATSAVLLYRLISFVFVAATGWVLCLATWRVEHVRTDRPELGGGASNIVE
jgi:uncharacterized protein (TIRG00374 family)